jgi:hypothetical protein
MLLLILIWCSYNNIIDFNTLNECEHRIIIIIYRKVISATRCHFPFFVFQPNTLFMFKWEFQQRAHKKRIRGSKSCFFYGRPSAKKNTPNPSQKMTHFNLFRVFNCHLIEREWSRCVNVLLCVFSITHSFPANAPNLHIK